MANGQGRESIDIEALLVRAYREKQVDRLGGGKAGMAALGLVGPRAPGATMGGGEKVDTSSYAARTAAKIRELQLRLAAAPDALLTLHDAVLALPDFYAEIVGLDFVVWDADTATALGHAIDQDRDRPTITKRRLVQGRDGAADAWRADGEARPLTRIVTATLLVVHGRDARRPDVPAVEVARMRPVYRDAHRNVAGRVPEYVVALDEIALDRARWSVWHCGLGMLAEGLADLPGYEVTGPSAPAAPWEAPPRILEGAAVTDLRDDPPEVARKPLKRRRKPPAEAADMATV